MKNEVKNHEALQKEFAEILSPFNAESMSARCADIVLRERIKALTGAVDHVEAIMDKLQLPKSHSDTSTGEWVNPNPFDPSQKNLQ